MPGAIFDWVFRTAMLAMAGLVTLSILGAIAAMTDDAGRRAPPSGSRPAIEGERAEEEPAAKAPRTPPGEADNAAAASVPGEAPAGTLVAAPPAPDDKVARWLEAIAYALLALAGIGALAVLMLWNVARELRRIGRSGQ
ncbi:MAG TPA: hypothetical protein VFR28_02275 [Allosphingosinicella sp.]|nr:hypothetical protein [Allosphingosinicella sp.]